VKRATALLLLVALSGPQAAPLAAGDPSPAPMEAQAHHHHPPGCPWQGTPDCPHDHHGPSSQPSWSPCAQVPLAVAGEARMAWAPPQVASREAPAPAPPATVSAMGGQAPPSDPHLEIEIPPPRSTAGV
jgi:hypothetical protein